MDDSSIRSRDIANDTGIRSNCISLDVSDDDSHGSLCGTPTSCNDDASSSLFPNLDLKDLPPELRFISNSPPSTDEDESLNYTLFRKKDGGELDSKIEKCDIPSSLIEGPLKDSEVFPATSLRMKNDASSRLNSPREAPASQSLNVPIVLRLQCTDPVNKPKINVNPSKSLTRIIKVVPIHNKLSKNPTAISTKKFYFLKNVTKDGKSHVIMHKINDVQVPGTPVPPFPSLNTPPITFTILNQSISKLKSYEPPPENKTSSPLRDVVAKKASVVDSNENQGNETKITNKSCSVANEAQGKEEIFSSCFCEDNNSTGGSKSGLSEKVKKASHVDTIDFKDVKEPSTRDISSIDHMNKEYCVENNSSMNHENKECVQNNSNHEKESCVQNNSSINHENKEYCENNSINHENKETCVQNNSLINHENKETCVQTNSPLKDDSISIIDYNSHLTELSTQVNVNQTSRTIGYVPKKVCNNLNVDMEPSECSTNESFLHCAQETDYNRIQFRLKSRRLPFKKVSGKSQKLNTKSKVPQKATKNGNKSQRVNRKIKSSKRSRGEKAFLPIIRTRLPSFVKDHPYGFVPKANHDPTSEKEKTTTSSPSTSAECSRSDVNQESNSDSFNEFPPKIHIQSSLQKASESDVEAPPLKELGSDVSTQDLPSVVFGSVLEMALPTEEDLAKLEESLKSVSSSNVSCEEDQPPVDDSSRTLSADETTTSTQRPISPPSSIDGASRGSLNLGNFSLDGICSSLLELTKDLDIAIIPADAKKDGEHSHDVDQGSLQVEEEATTEGKSVQSLDSNCEDGVVKSAMVSLDSEISELTQEKGGSLKDSEAIVLNSKSTTESDPNGEVDAKSSDKTDAAVDGDSNSQSGSKTGDDNPEVLPTPPNFNDKFKSFTPAILRLLEFTLKHENFLSSINMARLAKLIARPWKDVRNWFVARKLFKKKTSFLYNIPLNSCPYCKDFKASEEKPLVHLLDKDHVRNVLGKAFTENVPEKTSKRIEEEPKLNTSNKEKRQARMLRKKSSKVNSKAKGDNPSVTPCNGSTALINPKPQEPKVLTVPLTQKDPHDDSIALETSKSDHLGIQAGNCNKSSCQPVDSDTEGHSRPVSPQLVRPNYKPIETDFAIGFRCPLCTLFFQTEWRLIKHSISHRKYICYECDEMFLTEKLLSKHIGEHLFNSINLSCYEMLCCPVCQSLTCVCYDPPLVSPISIIREFKCRQVAKRSLPFGSRPHSSVNEHLKVTIADLLDKMGYQSKKKTSVAPSKRSCTASAPLRFVEPKLVASSHQVNNSSLPEPSSQFDCGKCDASFYTRAELAEHLFLHTLKSRKRSNVDENTSPDIPQNKVLRSLRHRDVKTVKNKETEFLCRVCAEAFESEKSLQHHLSFAHKRRRFHGTDEERDLVCVGCDKLYHKEDRLRQHMKYLCIHTPYEVKQLLKRHNLFQLEQDGFGTFFKRMRPNRNAKRCAKCSKGKSSDDDSSVCTCRPYNGKKKVRYEAPPLSAPSSIQTQGSERFYFVCTYCNIPYLLKKNLALHLVNLCRKIPSRVKKVLRTSAKTEFANAKEGIHFKKVGGKDIGKYFFASKGDNKEINSIPRYTPNRIKCVFCHKMPTKNQIRAHVSNKCLKIPSHVRKKCIKLSLAELIIYFSDLGYNKLDKSTDKDNYFNNIKRVASGNELELLRCRLCRKTFTDPSQLLLHSATHPQTEKSFECSICFQKALAFRNFVEHQLEHSGKTPYHCHFCSDKFSSSASLIRHLDRIHGFSNINYESSLKWVCTEDKNYHLPFVMETPVKNISPSKFEFILENDETTDEPSLDDIAQLMPITDEDYSNLISGAVDPRRSTAHHETTSISIEDTEDDESLLSTVIPDENISESYPAEKISKDLLENSATIPSEDPQLNQSTNKFPDVPVEEQLVKEEITTPLKDNSVNDSDTLRNEAYLGNHLDVRASLNETQEASPQYSNLNCDFNKQGSNSGSLQHEIPMNEDSHICQSDSLVDRDSSIPLEDSHNPHNNTHITPTCGNPLGDHDVVQQEVLQPPKKTSMTFDGQNEDDEILDDLDNLDSFIETVELCDTTNYEEDIL